MSVGRTVVGEGVSQWLPVGFRAVAAAALFPAALVKFVDYGSQAAEFQELGVPAAAVMVVFVGITELVTALALAFGVASRAAAVVAVVVMAGAISFAGLVPSNAIVLFVCLGVVAFGPGRYTVWNPETELLGRIRHTDWT